MSDKIIAFNINALAPQHKQQTLIHYINHYKPIIAIITETKLKPHIKVSIPNYKVFRCDRLENGGGGTMIIIRKSIKARQLSVQSNLFETCTIQCVANGLPIIVIAAYIPVDCRAKYSHFNDFFSQFNSSVIIGGDLNARHTNLGDVKCNSNGINIYPLHASGDFQVIHAEFPTCHRSIPGSFIDHFIVSADLTEVVSCKAENIVKLSDHTGIAIETLIDFEEIQAQPMFTRKLYNQANYDEINQEISIELDKLLIPTTTNLRCDDIESIVSSLHEIFQSVIDKHVPSSSEKSSVRISNRSVSLLKEKRRLCRLLNRRLNNQRAVQQEFVAIRGSINQIGIMIKNSLCDDFSKFYQRKLQQIRNNRDAFNIVRQFSQYKRKSSDISSIFLDENKHTSISNPIEIPR